MFNEDNNNNNYDDNNNNNNNNDNDNDNDNDNNNNNNNNNANTYGLLFSICFLFIVFYLFFTLMLINFQKLLKIARAREKKFRHQFVISMVIMQRVRNHSDIQTIAPIYKLFNLAYR